MIEEDPIYVMGYNRGFKNAIKASSPKANYEARLKADMVAMLTEIQLEIEEQKRDELSYQHIWNHPLNVCISIVQQKINALKADGSEETVSAIKSNTVAPHKQHHFHTEVRHTENGDAYYAKRDD